MAFPSPSLPLPDPIVRTLQIPNDLLIVGAVSGALLELTNPKNWEQNGEEIAAIMLNMLWDFWRSLDVYNIGKIDFFPVVPEETHLAMDGATYQRSDYPLLWDRIPASWQTTSTTFTLPDLTDRYLKVSGSYGLGGQDDFTLSASNIPLLSISYSGASPTILDVGTGIPVPAALPAPLVTTTGNPFPDAVDLNPSHVTLIAAIFAKFP